MSEPNVSSRGRPRLMPQEIEAQVRGAHGAGFQVGIHAIGAAAIDLVLDVYQEAQAANPRPDTRQ